MNPVFWLATWAGMMGPPSSARDSPYWSHARKLTKFVTFGQCWHIHRKKNKRASWVYCAANTVGFHYRLSNEQAILDPYQSEIFCYTMNLLMIKPREYNISWTSLHGQDYWILASSFFYLFTDRVFVSVHKNAKKTRPTSSYFDLTLGQWRIWIYFMQTHTNLAREDCAKNALPSSEFV